MVRDSDVVETVTSETRPRPRPRLSHKSRDRDRDLEVRDRDSRPHISLIVIKANSLKNDAEKYLECCQIPR